jgi:hypothetical protein
LATIPLTFATTQYEHCSDLADGLNVDVQSQSSGAAIAAGVAGGTYSFGKSSLPSVITAHTKGIPFARFIQSVIDACAKYKIIAVAFDAQDLIATGLD